MLHSLVGVCKLTKEPIIDILPIKFEFKDYLAST